MIDVAVCDVCGTERPVSEMVEVAAIGWMCNGACPDGLSGVERLRRAFQTARDAGLIRPSIVEDRPGRPVAAPCAIEGCCYGGLEQSLAQNAAMRGVIAEYLDWGPMTSSDRYIFERKFRECLASQGNEVTSSNVTATSENVAEPNSTNDWHHIPGARPPETRCSACSGTGGGETSMGGTEWTCDVCNGTGKRQGA